MIDPGSFLTGLAAGAALAFWVMRLCVVAQNRRDRARQFLAAHRADQLGREAS